MPSYYLLLIFSCIPLVLSQTICPFTSDSNYTSNSTYKANLNLLFTTLINNTPATGFYNDTIGNTPEKVYGLAQCPGDISPDECWKCMNTSVQGIVQNCPQQKSAIIWTGSCILRYSDQDFFSSADASIKLVFYNINNASQPERFKNLLGNLMNELAVKAVASTRRFAMGPVNYTSFKQIYGMLMCTRDLYKSNCDQCLRNYIAYIPSMGTGYQEGGVLLGMSCYLRFETYLFYNSSALTIETPSTSPVPSPPDTTVTTPTQVSSVPGKSSNTTTIVLATAIPLVVVILLFFAVCIYLRRRRRRPVRTEQNGGDEPEFRSAESLLFHLATIREATNNFADDNKLGEGGFGQVYKGILRDGQEIAVKRLARTSVQGLVELKNEAVLVAKLQHRNLVRMLGCCMEEQEKLLVYEYLPNSSLDKLLFDPIKCRQLDWTRRYKIIDGIARGLLYLHEDSRLRIIHRDLKASNILLDEDMSPKISDFGFAKLFGIDETQGNTSRIAGTYGYMAPEYVMHGQFSVKSDVYSYGVMMLEIMTGRRNSGVQESGSSIGLLSYEDPIERPTMASVVLMLRSCSLSLPKPSTPAFFMRSSIASESDMLSRDMHPNLLKNGQTEEPEEPMIPGPISSNDLSITEIEAR